VEPDSLFDHWAAADAVFTAALEHAAERRDAFVRRACRDDAALLDTVLALLRSHRDAAGFLEEPGPLLRESLRDDTGSDDGAPEPPEPGRVGPYRLVREIGRGGTGTVYLAERDDRAFRQRVAVKLLRRGLDTDDVLARFRFERQVLASLDHPNIARLLDGGATAEGRPYLVMELVEGRRITDHCDGHRLAVDERLHLFLTVGRAVQHAHRNLVVHRDLKPDNVLVSEVAAGPPGGEATGRGGEARVKLLDFGIAKLLDPALASGTTPHTRTGLRPMTPEYASPEQVQGGPVGVASDVYQLGVLLYELLTGRRPLVPGRAAAADVERAIPTREPEPPSSRVMRTPGHGGGRTRGTDVEELARRRRSDARRLRSRLRGDLDTIVLKALRREPERRYATVAALLEDVERHLSGRPVRARPDTWRYRARKFVGRHPAGVAAALALALAGAGHVATLQAHAARLERERDVARAERQQTEVARRRAGDEKLRAVAERGRAEAEAGRAEAAQVAAEVERDRAKAEAERAERALLQARTEAAKAEQVSAFLVGLFQASSPSAERTDTLSARTLLARGVERLGRDLHGQPAVRAAMLSAVGRIHTGIGLVDQAQPLLEEALSLRRDLFGSTHPDVAESLFLLAKNYATERGFTKAEPLYRESLAIRRRQPDADPLELGATLLGLAAAVRELGRADSAEILVREALTLQRRVRAEDHPDVVNTLGTLAFVLRGRNDLDGAEALYREVLAKQRANPATDPLSLAGTQNNLGYLLRVRGDYPAAESHYREALAVNRAILGEAHRTTAVSATNLASVLALQGKDEEAEAVLRERLEIERRHQPPNHWRTGAAVQGLAVFLAERGNLAGAEALLREAGAIFAAGLGSDHGWTLEARTRLGRNLTAQRRFDEAEALLLDVLATLEEAPRTPPRVEARLAVESALAELYEAGGTPEQAKRFRVEPR
jgi:eukaryotic-like serine/threonine-protein kinase